MTKVVDIVENTYNPERSIRLPAIEGLRPFGKMVSVDIAPDLNFKQYLDTVLPLLHDEKGPVIVFNKLVQKLLSVEEITRFGEMVQKERRSIAITAYTPHKHPYLFYRYDAQGDIRYMLTVKSHVRGFRQRHRKVLCWWPMLAWIPEGRSAADALSKGRLKPFTVAVPQCMNHDFDRPDMHRHQPWPGTQLLEAQYNRPEAAFPVHTNQLGMRFIRLPAGRLPAVPQRNCGGSREIDVQGPFWMQSTPVTRKQWSSVMASPTDIVSDQDMPITGLDFFEVLDFVKRLNALNLGRYRLPRGHEWEYACRAGTQTDWFFNPTAQTADRYAWHRTNSAGRPHCVAKKKPNPWGLYDMAGNIREYCFDFYHPEAKIDSSGIDLSRLKPGSPIQVRGGGFSSRIDQLRSSHVTFMPAVDFAPNPNVGFRLVLATHTHTKKEDL